MNCIRSLMDMNEAYLIGNTSRGEITKHNILNNRCISISISINLQASSPVKIAPFWSELHRFKSPHTLRFDGIRIAGLNTILICWHRVPSYTIVSFELRYDCVGSHRFGLLFLSYWVFCIHSRIIYSQNHLFIVRTT